MKIKVQITLSVFAASLLASCASQPTLPNVPGESKTSEATKRTVVSGIRQIENNQYRCAPGSVVIKNTKFAQASKRENTEEWLISGCGSALHTYMVSYNPETAEALIFYEETDKAGNSSDVLWATPKYDNDGAEIKKELEKTIEAVRIKVLNESSATEVMLQKGKGEQYGGKHWLSLCDTTSLKFEAKKIGKTMQASDSFAPPIEDSLCYKWYGTRHDWKETILKKE